MAVLPEPEGAPPPPPPPPTRAQPLPEPPPPLPEPLLLPELPLLPVPLLLALLLLPEPLLLPELPLLPVPLLLPGAASRVAPLRTAGRGRNDGVHQRGMTWPRPPATMKTRDQRRLDLRTFLSLNFSWRRNGPTRWRRKRKKMRKARRR